LIPREPIEESLMTAKTYEQLIVEGIKGLPREAFAEITDFVFFVKKRLLEPDEFKEDVRTAVLEADLKALSRGQEAHLEKEFENYDILYPRE
jgi:hypothetical protein